MREIKFRAWDKINNKYFRECNWLSFTLTGIRFIWHNPEVDKLMVTTLTDYELMQYTGLKDKNGKEIYEGDMVRHQLNNAAGEANKTYSSEEVVFTNGAFRNPRGFLIADYGYHQVGNQLYQAEVIGNIYENPLEK